ncbi:MAG: hypothetical protein H3C26_05510 [Rhodocyclaceae bacterium]|nr:hypothetical protein [Rhodocyclaceae bacterium]
MAMKFKGIGEAFEAFFEEAIVERGLIDKLMEIENGFEGWLKLEFYFWLIKRYNLSRSKDEIGMEWKTQLNKKASDYKKTKQCDLWVCDINNPDDERYHYIEIKAPFNNDNRGKMLHGDNLSASSDLWYISRIEAGKKALQYPLSGSVIILGVGFDATEWKEAVKDIKKYANIPLREKLIEEDKRHEKIRWAVLTHDYR